MLRWLAAILTIVRAFLVGYISDYDLGFSRQQIRTLAVVGAAIIDLICDALNAACALASSCWDKKTCKERRRFSFAATGILSERAAGIEIDSIGFAHQKGGRGQHETSCLRPDDDVDLTICCPATDKYLRAHCKRQRG
jgi:hypothetical protein